jgi:FixJ family two-component response regulator
MMSIAGPHPPYPAIGAAVADISMNPEQPIVHVVDDDRPFRKAVVRLLRAGGYRVGEYESAAQLLETAPLGQHGCVVTDLRMPGRSGLDLQEALADAQSPMPVIFLSGVGTIPDSVRAMRHGAEDFLTKPVARDDLFAAVDRALARDAEARERSALVADLQGRMERLTPREADVLRHVIAGKMNKQIAYALGTSERTIKAHRASISAKLQARSVAELVRLADMLELKPAE